jgi:hypothetical protein
VTSQRRKQSGTQAIKKKGEWETTNKKANGNKANENLFVFFVKTF